jgi:hypothetical protein
MSRSREGNTFTSHQAFRFRVVGESSKERNLVYGESRTYTGEPVAGVADEHACLADGAVPHRDALDELGHAHLFLLPRRRRRSGLLSSLHFRRRATSFTVLLLAVGRGVGK